MVRTSDDEDERETALPVVDREMLVRMFNNIIQYAYPLQPIIMATIQLPPFEHRGYNN